MKLDKQTDNKISEIWLAGGCFWGLEAFLDRLSGVMATNVGYANGNTENPSYEEVCHSNTGHAEAVYVKYDPSSISLLTLLKYYFQVIDPTCVNRQGNDFGSQYRTGIYYKNSADKEVIHEAIFQEQKKYALPIVTEVLPLENYFVAEEYHQKYLDKNPEGYCHIDLSIVDRLNQDARTYLRPSQVEIQKKLTTSQYKVTQENGTEPAFANEYWNNHAAGLYVDIVTGEPLFSSRDKYDSGTGWPSFTKPISPEVVITKQDDSLFMERVEVLSVHGESHLGHLFNDGPIERGGMRYCLNSAALRFIPRADMEREGYGEFISMVE